MWPLAVVGMACRFPGANDLAGFWSLLVEGRSGIVEVPPDWIDRDLYYSETRGAPGRSYCRHVGLVPPRPFDRAACPVPEALLAAHDPFHLTLVEVVAQALRDAGYDPFALPARRFGTWVANADGSALHGEFVWHAYADRLAGLLRETAACGTLPADVRRDVLRELAAGMRRDGLPYATGGPTDLSSGALAGLVARVFGTTGPALAADAACASSFVAVLLAAQAIAQGRVEAAIVAGASVRKWYELVMLSQIQSLGTTTSRPFDADADGFLGADGYAAVILKPVPLALADGDRILGVIRGMGMSTDGRGKSFWAPRREGQTLAIRRAYASGLDPARVSYVEAHATSTQLGDATEIASLDEALGRHLHDRRAAPVPVGAVKASIGHTLEVAGLAGLVKTLLAFRHATIPPAVGCTTSNPNIDWETVPFRLPCAAEPWPVPADGLPRRAAIDSFGIGGLNTHLVLDEALEPGEAERIVEDSRRTARAGADRVSAPDDDAVAVIGMGCLYPGAFSIDAFRELLASDRDPKGPCPPTRWHARVRLGSNEDESLDTSVAHPDPGPSVGHLGGYEFDWKRHKIPPKQVACANPLQFLILDAAEQALRDAGYLDRDFDRTNVGTVVGSVFTGDFASDSILGIRLPETQDRIRRLLAERGVAAEQIEEIAAGFAAQLQESIRAMFDETASYNCSTHASRITKAFDLMGGAFAVDAGDASALAALSCAADLLRSGTCRMVLCAAGQQWLDPVLRARWEVEGRWVRGTPHAWEDPSFAGVVPGEGAGVVLLKRLGDARRDGDRIRAVLRGFGAASGTGDDRQIERAALTSALDECGATDDTVGTIELASPVRGESPSVAPQGTPVERRAAHESHRTVASLVARLGHLQGGAGMASLQKAVLDLEQRTIPRTTGLTVGRGANTVAGLACEPATTVRPVQPTTPEGTARTVVLAGSAAGFGATGGTAWCVAVEEGLRDAPFVPGAEERAPSIPAAESLRMSPAPAPVRPSVPHTLDDFTERVLEAYLDFTGHPLRIVDWQVDVASAPFVPAGAWDAVVSAACADCGVDPAQLDRPALRTLQQLRDALWFACGSPDDAPASHGNGAAHAPDAAHHDEHAPGSNGLHEPVAETASAESVAAGEPAATDPTQATGDTRRFVLRVVPEPLPEETPAAPEFAGPCAILGSNPTGEALAALLTSLGATVHVLPSGPPPDEALAALDALWTAGPVPHLFVVTARDAEASGDPLDDAAWNARRAQGIVVPYLVCQRWFTLLQQAGLVDHGTLAATTNLGGDFGFTGHGAAVEGGALCGLLKGLDVETGNSLRVKVLDAPFNEPAKLVASTLLKELASGTPDTEVAVIRGRRHVVRTLLRDAEQLPRREIPHGSTWIVTGGGRGVTAHVARELGGRFGLGLHLLGTTPHEPVPAEWLALDEDGLKQLKGQILRTAREQGQSPQEAWDRTERRIELDRTLAAYAEAGVSATYHACDVSDPVALAAVIDAVHRTSGPVTGVLHGAGYESAGSFPKKTATTLERTLRAKVDSARAILSALRDDPVGWFVGFGSTSGRFGGFGQADYSAANDLLAKLLDFEQGRRPEARFCTIHWGAWDGTGMAVRPQSRSMLQLMKVRFMPPEEGAAFLEAELTADTLDSEVLAIDHPGGFFAERPSMPAPETCAAVEAVAPLVAEAPVIDEIQPIGPDEFLARAVFRPAVDPFLAGHLHEGVPLFPAVLGIESCAEATRIATGGRTVLAIHDLRLLAGFRMANDRPHRGQVHVAVRDGGRFADCRLVGDFFDKQGRLTDPHRLYHTCTVETGAEPRPLVPENVTLPPGEWESVPYPEHWTEMRPGLGGSVYYGPELRTLQWVQHVPDAIWGWHVCGAPGELGGSRPGRDWLTPSALFDSLLYACDILCVKQLASKQLPLHVDVVEFGRLPRPGEEVWSRCTIEGWDGPLPVFEGWVVGDDGEALIHMQGFHIVGLNTSLQHAVKALAR